VGDPSTPAVAGTPAAWRAAALGILVGGIAIGAAAASGGGAWWFVLVSVVVVVAGLVPALVASRRPLVGPDPAPPAGVALPTVSVVVAGRDEATVLPNLVADLARQDHRDPEGRPRFEVIVVDDRSTDGTSEAVREAATRHGFVGDEVRVIRREGVGLSDGKGAALTAAPPESCRGDVIVVLDADARIGPEYVGLVARYVACGVPALTARRRILDAGSSHLAGAQADEQNQDGELQRGRWASGGCSEFRGNGFAVRRDLLASVGGWRAEALTEDLDLSSRVAAASGATVAWVLDLEVWEEPVRAWGALWRQRLRWSEGAVRRLFEHGPRVMASDRLGLRARWDFAAYGTQLLAPPLIIGAITGAVVTGSALAALALVGTYLAAGGVLAFDALRWELDARGLPPPFPARLGRSVRAAVFSGIWLGALPTALWRLASRRGAVRYDKMTHGPVVGSAAEVPGPSGVLGR
jgi:hypothetical protein